MMIDFDVQLFPAGVRVPVTAPTVLDAADQARDRAGIAANWAHVTRRSPLMPDGRAKWDKYWIADTPTRVRFTDGVRAAVHFVGFRDPQQWGNAARLYGKPDFAHVHWDQRAKADVVDGDLVVFSGTQDPEYVVPFTYDDSNQPDDPAYWERIS